MGQLEAGRVPVLFEADSLNVVDDTPPLTLSIITLLSIIRIPNQSKQSGPPNPLQQDHQHPDILPLETACTPALLNVAGDQFMESGLGG